MGHPALRMPPAKGKDDALVFDERGADEGVPLQVRFFSKQFVGVDDDECALAPGQEFSGLI